MPPRDIPVEDWKLDPVAVKKRGVGLPGVQLLTTATTNTTNNSSSNDNPPIVSFLVGLSETPTKNSIANVARINVFCSTGTVSTTRIFEGGGSSSSVTPATTTRDMFRRNVTSLDVIERLLRHPPALTAIDEKLVAIGVADDTQHLDPTTQALKRDVELADVGLAILNGEKETLERHLESIDDGSAEDEQDKGDENQGSSSEEEEEEGMEFQFSLPEAAMKHVEQCLQDISRMNKLVRGVATNGKGTIFLYGNGGVAYTPNIPKALYQKLKLLRNSPISARPSYVSLGTRDRYFVAFKDDTFDWKGPKAMDKLFKGLNEAPRSVAFGGSYDTFFVVFADGSWRFHGKSIPEALADKLGERNDRADLVCVNLGPHGEWFLRTQNGRMWWGGISEELDAVTQEILQAGNFLHFLDFGEDGGYFLSHDS